MAFDAVAELSDKNTPALATQYVFDNYATQTTGLAMIRLADAVKPAAAPPRQG